MQRATPDGRGQIPLAKRPRSLAIAERPGPLAVAVAIGLLGHALPTARLLAALVRAAGVLAAQVRLTVRPLRLAIRPLRLAIRPLWLAIRPLWLAIRPLWLTVWPRLAMRRHRPTLGGSPWHTHSRAGAFKQLRAHNDDFGRRADAELDPLTLHSQHVNGNHAIQHDGLTGFPS